jgi:hypothetical protein
VASAPWDLRRDTSFSASCRLRKELTWIDVVVVAPGETAVVRSYGDRVSAVRGATDEKANKTATLQYNNKWVFTASAQAPFSVIFSSEYRSKGYDFAGQGNSIDHAAPSKTQFSK